MPLNCLLEWTFSWDQSVHIGLLMQPLLLIALLEQMSEMELIVHNCHKYTYSNSERREIILQSYILECLHWCRTRGWKFPGSRSRCRRTCLNSRSKTQRTINCIHSGKYFISGLISHVTTIMTSNIENGYCVPECTYSRLKHHLSEHNSICRQCPID